MTLCLSRFCENSQAQTAFLDNFEDPAYTAANWTNEAGAWRVKGGIYDQDGIRAEYNFSTVSSQSDFTDFTLDCDLGNFGNGGLIIRENPIAMTGLALIVKPGQLYFTTRKGSGFSDILSTAPLVVTGGSNLHLTLTAKGNSFTAVATLAGNPSAVVGSVSLSGSSVTQNLSGGRVGVYEIGDRSSYMNFDNFAVAVPEPGTWAVCLAGAGLFGCLRRRKK